MKIIMLTVLLFISVADAKETKKWYDGGSLHKASAVQWNKALLANQLATSSDWLTATKKGKAVIVADPTATAMKLLALELTICIDEIASSDAMKNEQANKIAALCVLGMGLNN